MATKLACVIYLESYTGSVLAIKNKLDEQGYEVHSFELAKNLASDVRMGHWETLPDQIAACLRDADLVVLLIDDDAETLGPIAGLGSDAGCRVVTVGGNPDNLPESLDDIIDAHLPNLDIPQAGEIIGGVSDRLSDEGRSAAKRKPRRVKCQ